MLEPIWSIHALCMDATRQKELLEKLAVLGVVLSTKDRELAGKDVMRA